MRVAGAGGGLREKPIAGGASGFLQSGFGFWSAPTQRAMRDAEPPSQTFHRSRLTRGFGAQAVIDRYRDELRAALEPLRPARCEHEQRRGIGPAGNRQNEAARIFQTRE